MSKKELEVVMPAGILIERAKKRNPRLSASGFYRAIREGKIPFAKSSDGTRSHYLIKPKDFEDYVKKLGF